MTTGWGAPSTVGQDANGNRIVTVGTMDSDIRRILGGLYTPGLISGGAISRSSTEFSYTVAAGVGIARDVVGQHIAVPWDAAKVTVAKPTSGTRTDLVYAQQGYPSDNNNAGDSGVYVRVGQTLPARSVLLGTFQVPSTGTGTSSAIVSGSVNYSIPYGGSLGILSRTIDTRNGVWPEAVGTTAYANNTTFTVPTDRLIRLEMTAAISLADSVAADDLTPVQPNFWPQIDNRDQVLWVQEVTRTWGTYYFSHTTTVAAGTHTARIARNAYSPSGRKVRSNYTGTGGHSGIVLTITDAGVAV